MCLQLTCQPVHSRCNHKCTKLLKKVVSFSENTINTGNVCFHVNAVVGEIETLPFLRHPWGQNNRGLFSRTLEAAASKPLLKQLPPLNYCRHRQSHLKETRPLRWTWYITIPSTISESASYVVYLFCLCRFNSRQHRCRSIVASDSSSTKEQKYTSRKQQAPLTEVGFLLTSAMQ